MIRDYRKEILAIVKECLFFFYECKSNKKKNKKIEKMKNLKIAFFEKSNIF